MGVITRNNYESYVIDYIDGTLDVSSVNELLEFLENNPDLKEEVELLSGGIRIQKQSVTFDEKEKLKKKIIPVGKINGDNYQEKFIAYYEGDLDEKEVENVLKFVAVNEFLEKEFKLFSGLFIEPDKSIFYPGKESLKKHGKFVYLPLLRNVAAALIILLAGIYFLLNIKKNEDYKFEKRSANTVIVKKIIKKDIPFKAVNTFNTPVNKIADPIKKKSFAAKKADFNIVAKPFAQISLLKPMDARVALVPGKVYERVIERHMKTAPDFIVINKDEKRSLTGKLFAVLTRKAKQKITEPVEPLKKLRVNNNDAPVFVKVFDETVKVFSLVTGATPDVEKVYNAKGELITYKYAGQNLYINKSLKKENN